VYKCLLGGKCTILVPQKADVLHEKLIHGLNCQLPQTSAQTSYSKQDGHWTMDISKHRNIIKNSYGDHIDGISIG